LRRGGEQHARRRDHHGGGGAVDPVRRVGRATVSQHDQCVADRHRGGRQHRPADGAALTRREQGEQHQPAADVTDALDGEVRVGDRRCGHAEPGRARGRVQEEPGPDPDDPDADDTGDGESRLLQSHVFSLAVLAVLRTLR
jgi:hypothetical protein